MDIGWLQRDFGIYVVNMFDTGQAARVLNFEKYSLAFLLKKFCDVTANKQYQLADWRIRSVQCSFPSEILFQICTIPVIIITTIIAVCNRNHKII